MVQAIQNNLNEFIFNNRVNIHLHLVNLTDFRGIIEKKLSYLYIFFNNTIFYVNNLGWVYAQIR